jgi:non-heme chloroperoxidase
MKRMVTACLMLLAGSVLHGQDLTGDWQGTLKVRGMELRTIVRITKSDSGEWTGTLKSIDQSPDWGMDIATSSFTVQRSNVKFAIDQIRGSYEGTLSADGTKITGTWTQGLPLPLELRRATPETAFRDPAQHSVQLVTVDKDVKLEVLDWGGTGRPLVLLAGLGNTAHVFDKFALKLTPAYHVYGITRRGFGDSSAPASGYAADRLGDDVLAVMDSLKIAKPVLAGHSLGGEELSSIGTRHPEKAAGLIYLDAGYSYAYDDGSVGPSPQPPAGQPGPVGAIGAGMQKYKDIHGPILAIFATPHTPPAQFANNPQQREAFNAQEAIAEKQVSAFEKGLPSAKVVRIPNADHFVFVSNEADVLKEMNAFIAGLGK